MSNEFVERSFFSSVFWYFEFFWWNNGFSLLYCWRFALLFIFLFFTTEKGKQRFCREKTRESKANSLSNFFPFCSQAMDKIQWKIYEIFYKVCRVSNVYVIPALTCNPVHVWIISFSNTHKKYFLSNMFDILYVLTEKYCSGLNREFKVYFFILKTKLN